jgi:hypothetical protein
MDIPIIMPTLGFTMVVGARGLVLRRSAGGVRIIAEPVLTMRGGDPPRAVFHLFRHAGAGLRLGVIEGAAEAVVDEAVVVEGVDTAAEEIESG